MLFLQSFLNVVKTHAFESELYSLHLEVCCFSVHLIVQKTFVNYVTFMHVWNYDKTHGLCTTYDFVKNWSNLRVITKEQ